MLLFSPVIYLMNVGFDNCQIKDNYLMLSKKEGFFVWFLTCLICSHTLLFTALAVKFVDDEVNCLQSNKHILFQWLCKAKQIYAAVNSNWQEIVTQIICWIKEPLSNLSVLILTFFLFRCMSSDISFLLWTTDSLVKYLFSLRLGPSTKWCEENLQ